MSRRLALVAAAVAVGGLLSPGSARAATPAFGDMAFSVRAEAFPVEPSPGTQDTELAIRASSTRASVTNPPVGGYAQATAVDLGLAEGYFGSQGPTVSADTATEGDDDVQTTEGGTHLVAHVDRSPVAWSTAEGNAVGDDTGGLGTVASRSSADGSGRRLVATAASEANNLVVGPLVIGSARYRAEAELDGTPDGARAFGVIEVSEATLAGVPVVLDHRGVSVDEERVPAPLVDEATGAVREILSPGGYMDVRVVQPRTEVADDGTFARASGGGIRVHLTSNDPTNNYFLTTTLLGGATEVFLGAELGVPTPDPLPVVAPDTHQAGPTPPAPAAASSSSPGEAPRPDEPDREQLELARSGGEEVLGLESRWPAAWLLLPLALAWIVAGALQLSPLTPARRRLSSATNRLADRYLRG